MDKLYDDVAGKKSRLLTREYSNSFSKAVGFPVHGSAEAVGLMCLYVFVRGDGALFEELKYPAMKLGSAFQKVNFLRDLKTDMVDLGRNYFPELDDISFNQDAKELIIRDIEADFSASLPGIKKLPKDVKIPVLIAYYYYLSLLNKIRRTPAGELAKKKDQGNQFQKVSLAEQSLPGC